MYFFRFLGGGFCHSFPQWWPSMLQSDQVNCTRDENSGSLTIKILSPALPSLLGVSSRESREAQPWSLLIDGRPSLTCCLYCFYSVAYRGRMWGAAESEGDGARRGSRLCLPRFYWPSSFQQAQKPTLSSSSKSCHQRPLVLGRGQPRSLGVLAEI